MRGEEELEVVPGLFLLSNLRADPAGPEAQLQHQLAGGPWANLYVLEPLAICKMGQLSLGKGL